jgi:hypothetical protein
MDTRPKPLPNDFHLTGEVVDHASAKHGKHVVHKVHIAYDTGVPGREPRLYYDDGHQKRTFTGGEIRAQESPFGITVSAQLEVAPDAYVKTLHLVLPTVLQFADDKYECDITAFSVVITGRTSIAGPKLVKGPLESYEQVAALSGTAKVVRH